MWKLSPNKIFLVQRFKTNEKKIIKNNLLSNLGHITKRIIFFLCLMVRILYVCVYLDGVTFRVCENLFQAKKFVRIKCRFCENFNWNFPFPILYFVIEIFSKFFFHLFFRDEIKWSKWCSISLGSRLVWFFIIFAIKYLKISGKRLKKTRLCYVLKS